MLPKSITIYIIRSVDKKLTFSFLQNKLQLSQFNLFYITPPPPPANISSPLSPWLLLEYDDGWRTCIVPTESRFESWTMSENSILETAFLVVGDTRNIVFSSYLLTFCYKKSYPHLVNMVPSVSI